eukprot:TRINITY_DN2477_c0_g1_i2.p1 TRINITY_DN2477_c0_g1~~TRINITY_DN2477_c0_g1_i2.p1  ORF type:complete len:324 (-),score=73.10 TRINITY_DN2477_c0_g1_i2:239-1210(-)
MEGPSTSHRFDLTREAQDDGGYDSTNEDDHYTHKSKKARYDLATKEKRDARKHAKGSKEVFREEAGIEEGRKQRLNLLSLSAYDRHKQLVNTYQLYYKGSTASVLQRDATRDKRDIDVIKEHHRFLWDEDESGEESWELQLAKRYYDKLFKEYCIIDLSRYKENKFGMRWRIEKEVVIGKGQFVCANKKCDETRKLRTWEVNFGYIEQGQKKNALVKCRLCFECSYKLNYHHKKKDVTKRKKKRKKEKKKSKKSKKKKHRNDSSSGSSSSEEEDSKEEKEIEAKRKKKEEEEDASNIWSKPVEREEEKTREEEFNDFLEDLFL